MKILHLGPDSQFVQFASQIFESVAPGCNEYIIFSAAQKLKFPPNGGAIKILQPKKISLLQLPFLTRNFDAIIAHGLDIFSIIPFLIAPKTTVKIWSGWGFDYYGLGRSSNDELLDEKTIAIQHNLMSEKTNSITGKFKSLLLSKARSIAIAKINYFSAPIQSDFQKMRKAFPAFSGQYAQINYGDVKSTFAAGPDIESGRNILVGNSAFPTNNHLEAFEMLSKKDLTGRKVIVPLSYGNAKYREIIIENGLIMLGDAFTPLIEFMPLPKYVETVASCGIVIMNHRRQQALGNIGSALYHGARVYLDERNPVYEFFKGHNAVIESMQVLKDNPLPNDKLTPDSINVNRNILEEHWGSTRVYGNVKNLIEKIGHVK